MVGGCRGTSAKVAVSWLRSAIERPATGLFRPSLRPCVLAPSHLARCATRRLRRSLSAVSRGGSFEGGTSDSLASAARAGHRCAGTVGGPGSGLRPGNAGTSATRWIQWWDEKSCCLRAGTRPQEAARTTRESSHSAGSLRRSGRLERDCWRVEGGRAASAGRSPVTRAFSSRLHVLGAEGAVGGLRGQGRVAACHAEPGRDDSETGDRGEVQGDAVAEIGPAAHGVTGGFRAHGG